MLHALIIRKPLTDTINSDPMKDIKNTKIEKRAVQDIKNNNM